MNQRTKQDLRVIKTLDAIKKTFRDMICEMDYKEITIKELTERAMINRKTFYLHYDHLDQLLEELQDEVVSTFTEKNISYRNINDIKSIITMYFEFVTSMPELYERLICSGSYQHIGEEINRRIMDYRSKTNKGAFSDNDYIDNIVFAYFSACSPLIYRTWVKDGKQLSVQELTDTAIKLICHGINAYVK